MNQSAVGAKIAGSESFIAEEISRLDAFTPEIREFVGNISNGSGQFEQAHVGSGGFVFSNWRSREFVNRQFAFAGKEKNLRPGHTPDAVEELRFLRAFWKVGQNQDRFIFDKEHAFSLKRIRQFQPVALVRPFIGILGSWCRRGGEQTAVNKPKYLAGYSKKVG